ncbi:MAG: nucleotide exchange factor GrpE [Pseudomonadales bacterium]
MTNPEPTNPQKAAEEQDQAEIAESVETEKRQEDEAQESSSLEDRLEQALAEVEKFKDAALRAEAEMQNVRRRAERDVEGAHKFGLERFVSNLLPVVDSLEKAVESAEQAAGDGEPSVTERAIIEGVGLCQKILLDVLAKEGVTPVDPVGEPFDPNLHQAMSIVENPNVEPNSVVAVVQKGYQLNERLVRPAMVMVSRAPSE